MAEEQADIAETTAGEGAGVEASVFGITQALGGVLFGLLGAGFLSNPVPMAIRVGDSVLSIVLLWFALKNAIRCAIEEARH